MPKERDDIPSPSEFVKSFQAAQREGRKELAKAVAVGLVIGYALRKKS